MERHEHSLAGAEAPLHGPVTCRLSLISMTSLCDLIADVHFFGRLLKGSFQGWSCQNGIIYGGLSCLIYNSKHDIPLTAEHLAVLLYHSRLIASSHWYILQFAVQTTIAIRRHPMATMLEAPGCGWAATTARPVRSRLPAATDVTAAGPMPRLQLVSLAARRAEHHCWHGHTSRVCMTPSLESAVETSQAQHCCLCSCYCPQKQIASIWDIADRPQLPRLSYMDCLQRSSCRGTTCRTSASA